MTHNDWGGTVIENAVADALVDSALVFSDDALEAARVAIKAYELGKSFAS